MKRWFTDLWTRLNPVDPSPAYLAKFMAFIIAALAFGLMIGRAK